MKKILVLTMAFFVFGTIGYAQKSAETVMKKQQLAPNTQVKDAKTGAVLKTVKPAKVVTATNKPVQIRRKMSKTAVQSKSTPSLQQPQRLSGENLQRNGNSTTPAKGSGTPAQSKQIQQVGQIQRFTNEDALRGKPSTTKKAATQSGNSTNKTQRVVPTNAKKLNKQ